jgi:hypothetical protein
MLTDNQVKIIKEQLNFYCQKDKATNQNIFDMDDLLRGTLPLIEAYEKQNISDDTKVMNNPDKYPPEGDF